MRVVVTGGAGFIGRSVVRRLAARGDQVVALVRDPAAASVIEGPTVELVANDLSDAEAMHDPMHGADGVIHLAGSYRVGIPVSERPAMYDANVGLTARVLDAAIEANVPRTVYISTINAFGNTRGRVVDETYRREPKDGYTSYYDETKWLAHLEAERHIADGAPIMIVQPGVTYGPGDHASVGLQLEQSYLGTAPYVALGQVGISPVHIEDLVTGIVAVLDRGRPGRAYVLGGPNVRLKEAMAIAARAGGHGPPRLSIPTWVLRLGTFLGPNLGERFGLSPNLREIMSASDGVTYWASSARAAAELGYRPRDLAAGFADAFGGGGR